MADSTSGGSTLYLHIGLYSGVYLRTVLDEVTGELSDTRTRFLGAKPVKLFGVSVKGQPAVLALSSRPWLGYSDVQTKSFMLTSLDYVGLEWGWNFTSEQCLEGMVGIQGQNLRYVTFLYFLQFYPSYHDEKGIRTFVWKKKYIFLYPIVPTEILFHFTIILGCN